MRRIVAISALATLALGWVSSSPADGPAPKPADLDQVLAAWQAKAEMFRTLSVGFTRVDKSAVWRDTIEYQCHIYLEEPNLACVHFRKVDAATRKAVDQERFVFTSDEMRQYDYNTRQIFVYAVYKDGQGKADSAPPVLFRPFLFRMKAEDVKRLYGLTLVSQNENAYLIGITPQPGQGDVFSSAFLQLGKKTLMPERLLLVDPNGKDTQDNRFDKITPNEAINPAFFQPLVVKGWKVVNVHPLLLRLLGFWPGR